MSHNLTVTIDDDLWREMQQHPEIRWSAVMKEAAREKLQALKILKRLAASSKLSEKDIEKLSVEIGKKIKRKASEL